MPCLSLLPASPPSLEQHISCTRSLFLFSQRSTPPRPASLSSATCTPPLCCVLPRELARVPHYPPLAPKLHRPTNTTMLSRLFGASDSSRSRPTWYDRQISPLLQAVCRRACTHPIHTIVFTALLASTTYLSVIESSLFNGSASAGSSLGKADFNTLLAGSKTLRVGPASEWKWQADEDRNDVALDEVRASPPIQPLAHANSTGRPTRSLPS